MAERDDLEYEVVRDLSRLDAVANEWDSLVEMSDCNRAFSAYAWFSTACRCIERKPIVILARRGNRLSGVLPMIEAEGGKPAFLTYLNDYNDVIAATGEVAAGLISYLVSKVMAGERIILRRVRSDSLLLKTFNSLGSNLGFTLSATEICTFVELGRDHDQFTAAKSGRFRKHLRRATRIAAENGLVVREIGSDSLPPKSLRDVFLSLHLSRFQSRSAFESAQAQIFIQELLPRLFQQGRLRVFGVFKTSKMIAIDLCMVGKKSLCVWNGGFLPEAEQWSPGKLMLDFEIRQARSEKLDELDLLRGPQPWKRRWATGTRYVAQIELSAATQHIRRAPAE
jgi:CelD/BcsL family acetyltransferase involved in cellulose biosynthesis